MIGTSPALDSLSSISPSFTTQSSSNNNLSDIAARVVAELQNDIENNPNDDIYDQFYVTQKEEEENQEDPEEEKEFEFAVVRTSPSVTADITLRYPLFDRSLLDDDNHDHDHGHGHDDESMTSSVVVRRPLRMLFNEERETTTSCSSSESDDLEGVTPGTYCVWKPKEASDSPDLRKKSNSTGNGSKRWKTFKKLLSRSNSHDGSFSSRKNDALGNSMEKRNGGSEKVFKKVENTAKVAGADDEGETGAVMVSVSDDKKSSNRFKSYLSYKQTV